MMSTPIKIVAFAGSLRKQSFNHVLAKAVGKEALLAGAEVEVISLSDFDIPLFDEDREQQGPVAGVEALKDKIRAADGLIVASPEYNGSISGVLKNAMDWVSRTAPDGIPAFANTTVALVATSPGGLGGIRGLPHARDIFVGMGALVLSQQLAVGGAYQAFNAQGGLNDEGMAGQVSALAQTLVNTAAKLK